MNIDPTKAVLCQLEALQVDDIFCLPSGGPLKYVSVYYQVVQERTWKECLRGNRYLPGITVPDSPKQKGYKVKPEVEHIDLKHGMVYLLARPGVDINDPEFEQVLQEKVSSKATASGNGKGKKPVAIGQYTEDL